MAHNVLQNWVGGSKSQGIEGSPGHDRDDARGMTARIAIARIPGNVPVLVERGPTGLMVVPAVVGSIGPFAIDTRREV
jgi:hypothetical protein